MSEFEKIVIEDKRIAELEMENMKYWANENRHGVYPTKDTEEEELSDDICEEDDGCPTENGRLRREWKEQKKRIAELEAQLPKASAVRYFAGGGRKVLLKKWIDRVWIVDKTKYDQGYYKEGTSCWEDDFLHEGTFLQFAQTCQQFSDTAVGIIPIALIEVESGEVLEVLVSNFRFKTEVEK
jgi:hypothetical protein